MKKIISLGILICLLIVSTITSFAACGNVSSDSVSNDNTIVTEVTREEYIQGVMECEGCSYDEVVARLPLATERGSDEVTKYAQVKKSAYTIKDGSSYRQTVMISSYVCYLYNKGLGKATSIQSVSSPYAYLKNVADTSVDFDHGDYTITKVSSSKYTIVVIGRFIYTYDGVTVTVGNDILSVSGTVGDYRVSTDAIALKANVLLSDL